MKKHIASTIAIGLLFLAGCRAHVGLNQANGSHVADTSLVSTASLRSAVEAMSCEISFEVTGSIVAESATNDDLAEAAKAFQKLFVDYDPISGPRNFGVTGVGQGVRGLVVLTQNADDVANIRRMMKAYGNIADDQGKEYFLYKKLDVPGSLIIDMQVTGLPVASGAAATAASATVPSNGLKLTDEASANFIAGRTAFETRYFNPADTSHPITGVGQAMNEILGVFLRNDTALKDLVSKMARDGSLSTVRGVMIFTFAASQPGNGGLAEFGERCSNVPGGGLEFKCREGLRCNAIGEAWGTCE
jgi:hypothetical protein